jgi:hypothetical protein
VPVPTVPAGSDAARRADGVVASFVVASASSEPSASTIETTAPIWKSRPVTSSVTALAAGDRTGDTSTIVGGGVPVIVNVPAAPPAISHVAPRPSGFVTTTSYSPAGIERVSLGTTAESSVAEIHATLSASKRRARSVRSTNVTAGVIWKPVPMTVTVRSLLTPSPATPFHAVSGATSVTVGGAVETTVKSLHTITSPSGKTTTIA